MRVLFQWPPARTRRAPFRYSGLSSDYCVFVSRAVHVRDCKVAAGPMLTVAPRAWAAFLAER